MGYGKFGEFSESYGLGKVQPRKVARKAVRKRAPKPVVPEPKPTPPPKPDPMRAEWFVHAVKGKTEVNLPCPEGELEAHKAVETMKGHGWTDVYAHVKSVPRGDGRFHQSR
jgi:hypothetical protein